MFEKASRMKLRFSYYGSIGVEELWDLSLSTLDGIYSSINNSLKSIKDDGLMAKKDKKVDTMELQLALIKHVYETKVLETEKKASDMEKEEKKRRIDEIIAKKKDSELEEKTIEELTSMKDAL
jgi:hypothetical protein